ncbi:hypothetical protein POTOM_011928 [Populus tomentosa]|uniref:Syntaxin N-terminal domain-containing protein n=2 Tax=Saliceae TaxID=238069 RepID=A0A8X8A8M4_POPTO|nr:hypothetical protein POTOM_011928 [Populus tomentosa]
MSFQDLEAGRPLASSRRELINGKQDATQAVASGIFQINTAVSTFQRLVNTLGTPKDTPELREKLHRTRLHIGQLVKDTSARLKQASETDHYAGVSQSKKIADAKLAKDFQAVLKEFQKAQRLAAERETAYAPFVPQAVLPSSYTASEVNVSSDKSPEQRALLVESRRTEGISCTERIFDKKSVCNLKVESYTLQKNCIQELPLITPQRQEVLLLDNEIVFNEAIIEEREQGIHEIQQQIDDIGSHIEGAQAATSQGTSQLVKAAKTQRSNSSLIIWHDRGPFDDEGGISMHANAATKCQVPSGS